MKLLHNAVLISHVVDGGYHSVCELHVRAQSRNAVVTCISLDMSVNQLKYSITM